MSELALRATIKTSIIDVFGNTVEPCVHQPRASFENRPVKALNLEETEVPAYAKDAGSIPGCSTSLPWSLSSSSLSLSLYLSSA